MRCRVAIDGEGCQKLISRPQTCGDTYIKRNGLI